MAEKSCQIETGRDRGRGLLKSVKGKLTKNMTTSILCLMSLRM